MRSLPARSMAGSCRWLKITTAHLKQFSLSASQLCHAIGMEKKPPEPDPNSKFAEVKKKAAELRAKKQMIRQEENRRAEQIPRPSDENDE